MPAHDFQYLQAPTPTPKRAKRAKKGRSGCVRLFSFLLWSILISMIAGIVVAVGGYYYLSQQLAGDIEQVVTFRGSGLGGTPRYFDRKGILLWEAPIMEKRQWLAYEEMPATIINATVAVEDDTFWTNPGFDPAALGAAIISNIRNDGRPVGGSTITQQLTRHIAFSYEERVGTSYERKAREIFYAFILTQQRSKRDILATYLNEIYYGNLAYGIEAAAQTYFHKPASQLSLAESAFLAGIPQSPVDWNPYANFEGVKTRQEFILDLMAEDGMIDMQTAQTAKESPIEIKPFVSPNEQATENKLEAPHFVLYVQDQLERRYGADMINRNGWQITTSLDLNIQYLAVDAARGHLSERAERHNVSNAAVVAIKPGSGEILAMVGSLDYFNTDISGQFNMALVPRQPGSSFKPLTFVTAMQQGWTTADVLWDVPITLDLGGGQLMRPTNYDGRFHGPVLLRDALANSYNMPPIQLLRDAGISRVIATARSMGLASLEQQTGYYGLSLTLGGAESPLLEMTEAYATLANGGKRPHLTPILKIEDSAGNIVFDASRTRVPPNNVIDPRIAFIISDILSDNRARTPAMGANSALNLPFPAAAKTGTTNDYRDNWTIGYTPGLAVGVWSGNTDGSTMRDSSGLFGAAPIWRQVMVGVYGHERLFESVKIDDEPPPVEFPMPAGVERREVCLPRGTGGTSCSVSREDWFIIGGALHQVDRLGYQPDRNSVPGAWSVAVGALPAAAADVAYANMPALTDGARPPKPTTCALSRSVADAPKRLLLAVPPFYPDEVRARLWAAQHGYQMAPSTVCSLNVAKNHAGGSGAGELSVQASLSSPKPGQRINRDSIPVWGSLNFNPGQISSVWLEVGAGENPVNWMRLGGAFSQPISGAQLGEISGGSLSAGIYTIRVVAAGSEGGNASQKLLSFQLQ